MSETAPRGVYVYQPHPVSRKDGRLWDVSGWPSGMTREQANAIADFANKIFSGSGLSAGQRICFACGSAITPPAPASQETEAAR